MKYWLKEIDLLKLKCKKCTLRWLKIKSCQELPRLLRIFADFLGIKVYPFWLIILYGIIEIIL
jgi:hypothetical protein